MRRQLIDRAEAWSTGGVAFIQLREKDLDGPQLQSLAAELIDKIDRRRSKLLVNISTPFAASLAAGAGADGVHLAGKPAPGMAAVIRHIFRAAGSEPAISVPCHNLEDVRVAVREQVDLLLFSPVFEKEASQPQGLGALRRACAAAAAIPVFALGGVTSANAADCLLSGAAGVAGIRLFTSEEWRSLLPTN